MTVFYFISHMKPKTSVVESIKARLSVTSSSSAQAIVDAIVGRTNWDVLGSLDLEFRRSLNASEEAQTGALESHRDSEGVAFSTLLVLRALVRLRLATREMIHITSDDVLHIPKQWPLLTELDLGGESPSRAVPFINHTHLLTILEGCPRLRTLSLHFVASRVTGKERSCVGPFSLEFCNVGDSPIHSPSRVTEFFKANFPNLSRFDICETYLGQPSIFEQRWRVVQSTLTEEVIDARRLRGAYLDDWTCAARAFFTIHVCTSRFLPDTFRRMYRSQFPSKGLRVLAGGKARVGC